LQKSAKDQNDRFSQPEEEGYLQQSFHALELAKTSASRAALKVEEILLGKLDYPCHCDVVAIVTEFCTTAYLVLDFGDADCGGQREQRETNYTASLGSWAHWAYRSYWQQLFPTSLPWRRPRPKVEESEHDLEVHGLRR
jgi:hypothetical protein